MAAIRGAGAMLIGKTYMVEYGNSAVGFNVRQGTPLNPFSESPRACGGSSSGSAAAVAAGLCPFALGMFSCPEFMCDTHVTDM